MVKGKKKAVHKLFPKSAVKGEGIRFQRSRREKSMDVYTYTACFSKPYPSQRAKPNEVNKSYLFLSVVNQV